MGEINLIYKSTNKKLKNKELEIIKKYLIGHNMLPLSVEYGVSLTSIKTIIRKNNIKIRNGKECRTDIYNIKYSKSRPKIKDQNIINEIINEYTKGVGCVEMGIKYKVTHRTILNILKRNNIKIRSNTEAQNHSYTKQRVIEGNIKKFGVSNAMQHPEIFQKSNLNRFKYKSCIIDDVIFDRLQGYEEQGIRHLLKIYPNITVNDIKAGRCQDIPSIKYLLDVERTYFPDIYVPKLNLLVEVKCEYTFKYNIEMNLAKQNGVINNGYNFLFIIFSNDGSKHLYNV
jgi:hypothetical protein